MSEEQKPAAAKKGGSKIIVIVVTGVLVAGAAVAGSIYGPKLLGAKPAAAHASDEKESNAAGPAGVVINFQPLVVDIHDAEGAIHHLKVGLAMELAPEKTEDELKNYVPRAREAAIAYLRSRDWHEVTSAKAFDGIKKELSERVLASVGKERASRILVTDFVAQ